MDALLPTLIKDLGEIIAGVILIATGFFFGRYSKKP